MENKPPEKNEKPMKRSFVHILSGLAIYVLITALFAIGIKLGLPPIPAKFSIWLSTSYDPQKALVAFSLLISGILLILLRIGVEAPFFNINMQGKAAQYIAGLPFWVLAFCTAASALAAGVYSPRCRPPEAIYFEIVGAQTKYQPMQILEVQPGQSLSITAKSDDPNVQLSCVSWEFVGPAFEPTGEKIGCQINLKFSDQPGISSLSVIGSQNFCDQKSIFSLQVQVKTP